MAILIAVAINFFFHIRKFLSPRIHFLIWIDLCDGSCNISWSILKESGIRKFGKIITQSQIRALIMSFAIITSKFQIIISPELSREKNELAHLDLKYHCNITNLTNVTQFLTNALFSNYRLFWAITIV